MMREFFEPKIQINIANKRFQRKKLKTLIRKL